MIARRDPIAKLLVGFVYLAVATLAEAPAVPAAIAGAIALWLLAVERIAPMTLLKALLPFAFFAATSSWIYLAAPASDVRAIAGGGLDAAALVALRILAVGLVAIAFALTTEPADLARALIARGRLPRRFVFGALAAIQFVPALREEARLARLTARAAQGAGGGLGWRLAGLGPGLAIVLLAGALRRAGAAAIAMELRGLGRAGALRWRAPRFGRRDAVFVTLALAGLAAALAAGLRV
jgi:energy-coupling factor transporter transmembrane protein EcfT